MDKLWIRSVQYVFLWISEIAFLRNPKTGPRRRNGATATRPNYSNLPALSRRALVDNR